MLFRLTRKLLFPAIALGVAFAIYNGYVKIDLSAKEDKVVVEWDKIQAKLKNQSEIADELADKVDELSSDGDERASFSLQGLVDSIKNAGRRASAAETPESGATAEEDLDAKIQRLIDEVKSRADLSQNEDVQRLMARLDDAKNDLAETCERYNEAADEFNEKRESFFGSLAAAFSGSEKRERFEPNVADSRVAAKNRDARQPAATEPTPAPAPSRRERGPVGPPPRLPDW